MKSWTSLERRWIWSTKVSNTLINWCRNLTFSIPIVIESRAKNRHAKDSDDATPSGQQPQLSLFEEGPRGKSKARKRSHRFTMAQLEQIEADKEKEVARGYKRMQDLWPLLLNEAADGHVKAKREWMLEAEKLVEMFRETKMLFLASRVNLPCFHSMEYSTKLDFRITPSVECLLDIRPLS